MSSETSVCIAVYSMSGIVVRLLRLMLSLSGSTRSHQLLLLLMVPSGSSSSWLYT